MTRPYRSLASVRHLPVRFFTQTHLLNLNTTRHHTKGTTVKPTEHTSKTPSSATGLFALLRVLLCVKGTGASKTTPVTSACSPIPVLTTLTTIAATLLASVGLLIAALPASASAYATIEGPPTYSSAPGLPDNRVYEQVSPVNKNGNQAGASTSTSIVGNVDRDHWGYAALDGNSVLFEGSGPMGETASPDGFMFVAQHSSAGWSTHSAAPALHTVGEYPEALAGLVYVTSSLDLSRTMLNAGAFTLAPLPNPECYDQLYLAGSDPFVPATWLSRPETPNPIVECPGGSPVGGTPNFSTVYFTSTGTLLPADASRVEGEGFYEDSEGVLHEAGVLPDGGLDPFGAIAAASSFADNEVSSQPSPGGAPAGSRVFFVSPDPAAVGSCETAEESKGDAPAQAAVACAPQLYVHEQGEERAVLVSRDTLLPETDGLPASAPTGAFRMPNAGIDAERTISGQFVFGQFVFASPDGSQAFFQSEDALTEEASQASPGTSLKTYDFDLDTGTLSYLPGASGDVEIVATDADGSSFAFVRPEAGGTPAELDLWSAGANGGSVTPVTQLPGGMAAVERMSSDGSVLVFQATGTLSSAFNSGGQEQVYRYDVLANTLSCVSCAPPGVQATSASMSGLRYEQAENQSYIEADGEATAGRGPAARGISANGDRVFFDTATPLVPQDTNTNAPEVDILGDTKGKQGRDVYEWENGVVYLISGGKSPRDSFLLDSSENGDDVFFATTEGLVPGDTDGTFDVYDGRVPRETPTPAAVPCEGSVCQGPPNVPSPLTPPASATFAGLGNHTPEVTPSPPAKTTTKTVKCEKGFTQKKNKCVKAKTKRKAKKASHNGRTKS